MGSYHTEKKAFRRAVISGLLRDLRARAGLSRRAVADALKMDTEYYADIERGSISPYRRIGEIARVLGVDASLAKELAVRSYVAANRLPPALTPKEAERVVRAILGTDHI